MHRSLSYLLKGQCPRPISAPCPQQPWAFLCSSVIVTINACSEKVCEAAQACGAEAGDNEEVVTTAACGECQVTTRWLGFYRVWRGSGEVFDSVDLFLPDVQFNSQVRGRLFQGSRHVGL